MIFTHFLDLGARINSEGVAFVAGDRRWSYGEVQRFTYRFAHKLRSLGFGLGDKGAVLSNNNPVAFFCAFGLHRADVAWIPANPRNPTEDMRYTFDKFDCGILLFHSDFAEAVRTLRPQLTKVTVYVCIDRDIEDIPSLDRWLHDAVDDPVDSTVSRETLAVVMPTGGTTGRSKGVMLTERNLYNMCSAYLLCFVYAADEKPVAMAAAPLTHAAGLLSLPTLARGGTVIILAKPEVIGVLDTIERYRVTEFFLPPTVIYRMLDHPGIERRDFQSVKYFGYGSAPISVAKLRRAIEVFGPRMTQMFGQSEAPLLCTFLPPQEHVVDGHPAPEEVLSSCGRPTPIVKVRILDENNAEVPQGEAGEVCINGDLVTPGYYGQPDITAQTIVDGWLHTGDIGFFDADGRLHLCDRKKDMIISGGLNVYPQEIEQIIWAHPAVQDCAVIGAPDPEWGEVVTAVIQLRQSAELSTEEIITLCKVKLGSVKCPKKVTFVSDLPRNAAGKVLKRVLRDQYWSGFTRKI